MYTLLYIIYNFILLSKLNVIAWYNIIPYYNILIYKKFELTFSGRVFRIILYCIPLFHIIVPLYYSYLLSIQKKYINKNWSRMASM